MSTKVHFYATKDDISSILNSVQAQWQIKYVRFGLHSTDLVEEYDDFRAIETLGIASNESHSMSTKYVVCDRKIVLLKREIERGPNAGKFLIDQLVNPDTIVFASGGIWRNDILIAGQFSTVHNGDYPTKLMRFIKTNMAKSFQKEKIFYVGSEALRLAHAGFRLTQAEQSPREFDLALGMRRS